MVEAVSHHVENRYATLCHLRDSGLVLNFRPHPDLGCYVTEKVEAVSHYGGSHQPLWWKPSATMVEAVSHHGGICQRPWWKPSAAMVEAVSHHGGIRQPPCGEPLCNLVSSQIVDWF